MLKLNMANLDHHIPFIIHVLGTTTPVSGMVFFLLVCLFHPFPNVNAMQL